MTIEEKLKALPASPGVYLMYDDAGKVIYVGKALSLKNRVRQYFNNSVKLPKVQAMVDAVADFGYILTLSEKDALSLEANLVKKYMPRYNILLKDDKHSPYIRIDTAEEFPRLEVVRRFKKDGAKYFGPFFGGIRVADVVDVIRGAYKVRICNKKLARRECLNYHIGLCLAPCVGKASSEEYRAAINKVMAFLSGKNDEAERLLTEKMALAAEDEQFERAIQYRERLKMLALLKERNISSGEVAADTDAIAFVSDGIYSAVTVNVVRGNKMMGVKNYSVTDASLSPRDTAISFVIQYYGQGGEVPSEILFNAELDIARQNKSRVDRKNFDDSGSCVDEFDCGKSSSNSLDRTDLSVSEKSVLCDIDNKPALSECVFAEASGRGKSGFVDSGAEAKELDFSALQQYLAVIKGGAVNISVPQKGMKKRLVEMAERNALDYLQGSVEKMKRKRDLTIGGVERLRDVLGLRSARRIECFDISNISGTDSVASGVVFIDGSPAKSEYRRYRIKTVVGADDYASMREVISRRLGGDTPPPDLIVIDGGKGQLSSAASAMYDYLAARSEDCASSDNVQNWQNNNTMSGEGCENTAIFERICAVVGAEGIPMISLAERDEHIFTLGSDRPIVLAKSDFALRLLVRLRDEAHRFALTYHRTLRGKRQTSELLQVEGVGKKKLERITKNLTFREIKSLSASEIAERSGIDLPTAARIEDFYKK